MKQRSSFLVFLFWVMPGLVLAGILLLSRTGYVLRISTETDEGLEKIKTVLHLIEKYYVDEVDSANLFEGALNGMVGALDPHSQYLTQELYMSLEVGTKGRFGGLGVEVTMVDGRLSVITVLDGTPAFRAGMRPGDRILEIGGESTEGMTLAEAVKKMRGEPGTSVELLVLHEGETEPVRLTIVRDEIRLKSVKGVQFIDEELGIAYLRLVSFQESTSSELREAVEGLLVRGMKGLIIDLRFNGGGLLEESVQVADLFLEGGVIVSMKGRQVESNRVYEARAEATLVGFPLVLLVNGYSASAAEIFAGAIQDHERGVLVGSRTYGKGSVQRVFSLGKEGTGVRLTTAKYFTPLGRPIDRQEGEKEYGLEPDELVEMDRMAEIELFRELGREDMVRPEERERERGKDERTKVNDVQLLRAIEVIKGMLKGG